MDFLLYLSAQQMDIYKMVSKKSRVVENAPVCRKYKIFGFYDSRTRVLTMCTGNIKKYNNVVEDVNKTFMHEAVHVAQSCKTNFDGLGTFGINPSIMSLSNQKEKDLKKVIDFDYRLKYIDREAFWMEDKPEKVKYVIQKYCF